MIDYRDLKRLIDNLIRDGRPNDEAALRELDIDANAVEAMGYDLAAMMVKRTRSPADAIAAAFAAGLEVGVRLERERNG